MSKIEDKKFWFFFSEKNQNVIVVSTLLLKPIFTGIYLEMIDFGFVIY